MTSSEHSFEELLLAAAEQPHHLQAYALALAKSRTEEPSEQSLEAICRLVVTQGGKWLEVLERQASCCFELAFRVCNKYSFALPVLVSTANYRSNFL
jgi:hypothetical protein